MAKVTVEVNSIEEIKAGIALLSIILAGFGQHVTQASGTTEIDAEQPETEEELDFGMEAEEEEEEIDLEEEEEEEVGPTVDDLKDAYKALVKAIGKEDALDTMKKIFAKLKVKKMEDIPVDKRPTVISILGKKSA